MVQVPCILIAIPAYGGSITTGCLRSLLNLIPVLQERKITFRVSTIDQVDIVTARNALASQLLIDDVFSHLLFIDNDMIFTPATILRMLDADKKLIGCACPKRQLDLSRALELAKHHSAPVAVARASEHNVVHLKDRSEVEIRNGLCMVESVGTGICVIARSCFTDLIAAGKLRRTMNAGVPGQQQPFLMYGFFDPIITQDRYLSEDLSFCARWRDIGGEVWAMIAEDIGHVGTFVYRSRLIDALKG